MQTQLDNASTVTYKKSWRVWWRLTRPHTLTASFVPVILGTVIAMNFGTDVNVALFLMMLLASILIQISTNLFNEYYDYKRGLDNEDSVGIGGGIVRDGIKPKTIMQLALSLYGISLLIGIYICMNSSWTLALVGLACMLIGYLIHGWSNPNCLYSIWRTCIRICYGNGNCVNFLFYTNRHRYIGEYFDFYSYHDFSRKY